MIFGGKTWLAIAKGPCVIFLIVRSGRTGKCPRSHERIWPGSWRFNKTPASDWLGKPDRSEKACRDRADWITLARVNQTASGRGEPRGAEAVRCSFHFLLASNWGALLKHIGVVSFGALFGAISIFAASPDAKAQDGWVGGRPVFDSDIRREKERWDREREERRKNYTYNVVYPPFMTGGPRPEIIPMAPPIVSLKKPEKSGTIIIDTGGRRLFYVLSGNRAYEYPISVGREGFTWTGTERISRIAPWPDWHPPAEMLQRQPGLPKIMTGGVNNPLGAKALYLGNTLYRIHGTNDPKSIGRASSSGCFRMMNNHVEHLATLAGLGTEVRVVRHY